MIWMRKKWNIKSDLDEEPGSDKAVDEEVEAAVEDEEEVRDGWEDEHPCWEAENSLLLVIQVSSRISFLVYPLIAFEWMNATSICDGIFHPTLPCLYSQLGALKVPQGCRHLKNRESSWFEWHNGLTSSSL